MQEQDPVEKYRQQEVGRRPREDDREALVDRLAIEGARKVLRMHPPFTLIDHFYVAAQRESGDHPLCRIATETPAPERRAEAHGEAQDFHVAEARHEIVPELVNDDQQTERDNERGERDEEIHRGTL